MSEHCGRLDDHEPHDWLGGHGLPLWMRTVQSCPGEIVIEGGHIMEPVEPLGPRARALAEKHAREVS